MFRRDVESSQRFAAFSRSAIVTLQVLAGSG
jgi:hypothetical protein